MDIVKIMYLILIEPQWNVDSEDVMHFKTSMTILIEPQWNVDIVLTFEFSFTIFSILIEPQWNVDEKLEKLRNNQL